MGTFLIIATFAIVLRGGDAGLFPVLGPAFGVVALVVGVLSFFRPVLSTIEVRGAELVLAYVPKKSRVIPRKDILRVEAHAGYRIRENVLRFMEDEQETRLVILGRWRGDDGVVHKDLAISFALNAALRIVEKKI